LVLAQLNVVKIFKHANLIIFYIIVTAE